MLALAPSAPATFPGKNGKIAFVRGFERIFTIRPGGSHVRPVVSFAEEPDYSPSGRRILFVFWGHPTGVYTSRPDGTKRRLIPHSRYPHDGAFAPSGKRIVVVRYPPPYDDYLMYTMRLDGSHRHRIASDVFDPTFSPNGRWIAFDDGRIGLMRADGSGKRLLTDDSYEFSDHAPDFSPDGRRIVFGRNGDETSGIYTIRKDGTHLRRVYEANHIRVSDPVFSPNGQKIAFARWQRREPGGMAHHPKLYTMRLDGSHLRRLSHHDTRRHSKPSWGVRP